MSPLVPSRGKVLIFEERLLRKKGVAKKLAALSRDASRTARSVSAQVRGIRTLVKRLDRAELADVPTTLKKLAQMTAAAMVDLRPLYDELEKLGSASFDAEDEFL